MFVFYFGGCGCGGGCWLLVVWFVVWFSFLVGGGEWWFVDFFFIFGEFVGGGWWV